MNKIYLLILFIFYTQISVAQLPSFVWGKVVGDSNNFVDIYCQEVDPAGNVYSVGVYKKSIDVDPGPGTFFLNGQGNYDILILKLNTNGNLVWAKSIGGPGMDWGMGLSLDQDNNLVVCGTVSDPVNFDPGPATFVSGNYPISLFFTFKTRSFWVFFWLLIKKKVSRNKFLKITTANIYYFKL